MDAPAMLVDSARADQDACDDVPDCAVSYQSARHAATQVTDLLRDDAFAGDPAAGAERATALLSAFQEHGELLDAYLPDLVSRIASLLTGNKQCPPIVDACSLMIYTLCNVRGASTVRQLLPHTVADLTFVTDYLGAKRDPVPWTTQYALMQWLAVCVLVPFQLETILPYADPSRALLDLSITYLCRPVPLSSAAAACTARILSRSDPMANDRMQQFLQRILPIVADANDANDECIGAMTALVQVLKVVPRDRVQQYAPTIADACLARDTLSSSVTVRKLSMKILQRAGLSMMPNSIPSWLYNRGRRSLLHALTWPGSSYKPVDEVSSANSPKGDVTPGAYGLVLDKIYDLVRVESIIARLLAGLSDANTVVRWSSAKGIGRCTMRLGRQLADDIVSSVFDNLRSEPYNADVWHGGLLCLAELIRRGLILPERLHEVIPIVVDGLVFERSRGSHAVGVHVRDSACFVAWSLGRAYTATDLAGHALSLACALVPVAVFDRDVNVRRAASAAFQENAGRHGLFPEGIRVTTTADYASVGIVSNSFKRVAPAVAAISDAYRHSLVRHLLMYKVGHWDLRIRLLSGDALSLIDPASCADVIPRCLSDDISERHGAIHALSCCIRRLGRVPDELQGPVRNLPIRVETGGMFKGRGSDMLRSAVCALVESISAAGMPLASRTVEKLHAIVIECLEQPLQPVQLSATSALRSVVLQYSRQLPLDDLVDNSVHILETSLNVPLVRGHCMALGVYNRPTARTVLALIKATLPVQPDDRLDVETRVQGVHSLASLLSLECAVAIDPPASFGSGHTEPSNLLLQVLVKALDDYAIDSRGDVGSWVRLAAMEHIAAAIERIQGEQHLPLVETAMQALVKQACEKLDRIREAAWGTLMQVSSKCQTLCSIVMQPEDWVHSHLRLAPLLGDAVYGKHVFSGLILSAGGQTVSVSKSALRAIDSALDNADNLCETLAIRSIALFDDHQGDNRVTVPLFKTLGYVLTRPNCRIHFRVVNDIRKRIIRESRTISSRIASIPLVCALLQFNALHRTVRDGNFRCVMKLLVHRFPRIRSVMAESLYSQLVALDAATVGLDETQFNAVLDIVLGVSWLECPDEEQIASLQTSLGIVTNASGARLSQTKLYDQSSTLSDNGHYCYSDFVSGLSHP
ncbi:Tubulin-specific chaperone D C-terminal domain-containing protein [Plasmodiophora brassicae]|uniref:Uncharacterized protein n=1 Tax=Plasmodiophora brassicae TaxID=37360 RepID=A0A0G4J0T6_PLABS|nr:hypothetical protein PBRA_008243 [Plasmodiophora brassicae]